MKYRVFLISCILFLFPCLTFAQWEIRIPTDISIKGPSLPRKVGGQTMSDEECKKKIGGNVLEFCTEAGPAKLDLDMAERNRMMALVLKMKSRNYVFVHLNFPQPTLKEKIKAFKSKLVKKRGIYHWSGAYGLTRIYAYYPDDPTGHAFVVFKYSDYVAEKQAGGRDIGNVFKLTYQIINNRWFPAIRNLDAKILRTMRLMQACCTEGYYISGGYGHIGEEEWTHQETRGLVSGKKSTRSNVRDKNTAKLERYKRSALKATTDKKKSLGSAPKVQPPEKPIFDRPEAKKGLGGGLFGHGYKGPLKEHTNKNTTIQQPKK